VGIYRISITDPARYFRYTAALTSAGVSFGNVVIGPTFGGDYDIY
jgi:hypothetical protein